MHNFGPNRILDRIVERVKCSGIEMVHLLLAGVNTMIIQYGLKLEIIRYKEKSCRFLDSLEA